MHMRAKSICGFQISYRPRTAVIYGRCGCSLDEVLWNFTTPDPQEEERLANQTALDQIIEKFEK